jgi:hypothetical protein
MINEVMTTTLEQAGANVLSAAIGVLSSRLAAAAKAAHGRKAEDLSIARWFETYKLTKSFPELPGLSPSAASLLADVLGGDAVQAALQELLAARLTDADDLEAGRVRDVFCLTLTSADPSLSSFGPLLAEYYDEEIGSLVARLEAAEPALLAQIRSEALSARMIAVLRAIERHTAALNARPNARSEASFLASYRNHVRDEHGKLKPPDFDHRRLVPIADIYVPARIHKDVSHPASGVVAPGQEDPAPLSVWDLAGQLDRTVLLGDPGGGKTTASNVLMHYFASDETGRIPFLVTLRNYAAAPSLEHSVVGHIEGELDTFYQCPAPPGIVDMLLLTGRAIVIFDGLDELLDTSRRADIASRVEHFCREYPLASVLVTSRVVGYDQARLDETQFTSFRLGEFRDEDVADYAHKWFALQEGARPNDADAFLTESESVPDLRTNPLLLSLMCILYRGAGSLPRRRAEIYEECAKLLYKRWDTHRHIHKELRADRYVEQILRHLAWWLFTRDNSQTAVTGRNLIGATTDFLHGRGFESEDDARDAAHEFIEFCCGRMWVFSDAGTTATGEKLFSFTHRTFLEFFAAAHLAYHSDTPEQLARTLAPHAARNEWDVVGELAIQIKDGTSAEGAGRIFECMISERRRRSREGRSNILQFLARSLRSVTPAPHTVRHLAREALHFLFTGDPDNYVDYMPLARVLATDDTSIAVIAEEVAAAILSMTSSADHSEQLNGLRLALSLDCPAAGIWAGPRREVFENERIRNFWSSQVLDNAHKFKSQIFSAAVEIAEIRNSALKYGLIEMEQAIRMTGGLGPLIESSPVGMFAQPQEGHLFNDLLTLVFVEPDSANDFTVKAIADFAAVGRHITGIRTPPWVDSPLKNIASWWITTDRKARPQLDQLSNLGAMTTLLICVEAGAMGRQERYVESSAWLGPFGDLHPYIKRRLSKSQNVTLTELAVPSEFKQVFRDWAEGKVNFVAPAPDPHTPS